MLNYIRGKDRIGFNSHAGSAGYVWMEGKSAKKKLLIQTKYQKYCGCDTHRVKIDVFNVRCVGLFVCLLGSGIFLYSTSRIGCGSGVI